MPTKEELTVLELQRSEHQRWQELCAALQAAGAVTAADCNAKLAARGTPGEKLFASIRVWGEALIALRVRQRPRPRK
ncbi:MAG TPA: hypothetical protein VNM37_13130 [Candidatus Dormibacteraeota bacterium]|nr:hypothetical protein [Candidatus Dormibacteraeota bacterium]